MSSFGSASIPIVAEIRLRAEQTRQDAEAARAEIEAAFQNFDIPIGANIQQSVEAVLPNIQEGIANAIGAGAEEGAARMTAAMDAAMTQSGEANEMAQLMAMAPQGGVPGGFQEGGDFAEETAGAGTAAGGMGLGGMGFFGPLMLVHTAWRGANEIAEQLNKGKAIEDVFSRSYENEAMAGASGQLDEDRRRLELDKKREEKYRTYAEDQNWVEDLANEFVYSSTTSPQTLMGEHNLRGKVIQDENALKQDEQAQADAKQKEEAAKRAEEQNKREEDEEQRHQEQITRLRDSATMMTLTGVAREHFSARMQYDQQIGDIDAEFTGDNRDRAEQIVGDLYTRRTHQIDAAENARQQHERDDAVRQENAVNSNLRQAWMRSRGDMAGAEGEEELQGGRERAGKFLEQASGAHTLHDALYDLTMAYKEFGATVMDVTSKQEQQSATEQSLHEETQTMTTAMRQRASGQSDAAADTEFAAQQKANMDRLMADPTHTQQQVKDLQQRQTAESNLRDYQKSQSLGDIQEQTKEMNLDNSGDHLGAEQAHTRYEYDQMIQGAAGDPKKQAALRDQENAALRGEHGPHDEHQQQHAQLLSPMQEWLRMQPHSMGEPHAPTNVPHAPAHQTEHHETFGQAVHQLAEGAKHLVTGAEKFAKNNKKELKAILMSIV